MIEISGPEFPPANGNKPKQLVVILHGVGADGDNLIDLAYYWSRALPDAHFVAPNGPERYDMLPPGYPVTGYQWFSLQDRHPQKLLEGARRAEPMLNAFIDAELKKHNLTAKNLVIAGFSQGGMMALFTALRRKEACAGVMVYSGALVGPDLLASEIKSKPPVCWIHGEQDEVVPFGLMAMAEPVLKNYVTLETHARPGLGHSIDMEGLLIGEKFLQKVFA